MKDSPLTDADIEGFIDNDEALYLWQLGSGLTMEEFIREYRDDLVKYINELRRNRQ
jgi:hypothetical protein